MPDPNYIAKLLVSQVPEVIRKSISAAELNDRLVEAARLSVQARDPALSAGLRKAASLRAQAVLRAQPRLATRRQHAELIAKAAVAPRAQAEALRRKAERLVQEEHPIAPGRAAAVRKEADSEPIPVFNQAGDLIGICDPEDLTPVSDARGADKEPEVASAGVVPVPAAAAQQVAKSSGRRIIHDQWRRRYLVPRGGVRQYARRSGR